MSNILRIRTLTDRFFDGETTLAEEQELYAFFSQASALLPEDLRPLRDMFLDLAAVQCDGDLVAQTRRPSPPGHWHRWAAVAALLLVGGALLLFNRQASAEEECVAYVYGQFTNDPAVVLSEMQRTMLAVGGDGDVVEKQLKAMFGKP